MVLPHTRIRQQESMAGLHEGIGIHDAYPRKLNQFLEVAPSTHGNDVQASSDSVLKP